IVDRPEEIAGRLNVVHGHGLEDGGGVEIAIQQCGDLVVIGGGRRDSLLEDRWIRRQPANPRLLDGLADLTAIEHVARDIVLPDALPFSLIKLFDAVLSHGVPPFRIVVPAVYPETADEATGRRPSTCCTAV